MKENILLYKPLYHKGKLLICHLLALTTIFSCNEKDITTGTGEQTEKASVSVQSATSDPLRPNVIVQETFEGSSYFPREGSGLNVISTIENCGTSWTLSTVTNRVFQDTKSSRFEIRKDQPLVGSSQKIRSEVTLIKGDDGRFSPEMWYSFAMLVPSTGFEYDKTRDCINQWFEDGSDETTLRIQMDRAFLEVCPPAGSSVMKLYDLFAPSLTGNGTIATFVPIPKDQWHEFVFHFKHSFGDDGLIEVWRNGLKIHSINGRNIHKEMPKWKLGLYKTSFLDKTSPWYARVIYFDNIRVGKAAAKFSEMSSNLPVVAKPAVENKIPIVNAGNDIGVVLPTEGSVYLIGNVHDADGSVKTVKWSQVSGPDGSYISGDNTLSPKLVYPKYGKYVIRLTVTDDRGGIGTDDVVVNVTSSVNIGPTANAGPDKTVTGSSTTLDGSGSVDLDGSITIYKWSVSTGPQDWSKSIVLGSPNAAKTNLSGLIPGVYIFRLDVTDNKGATASDKITVTVTTSSANLPPTAKAGPDQAITLPATLTLNGSNSTDADGTIVNYAWTKVSGPSSTISSPSSAKTTVTGLAAGTYVFRLKVTDNMGATDNNDVTAVVKAAAGPTITSFTLIDAATEKDLLTMTNGAVYDISQLGTTKFNIRANTVSAASVKFELTGAQSRTIVDSDIPFALMGDDGNGNYYYGTWNPPAAGTYTLKTTPYSGTNASGTAGTASTINFSFTN